MNHSKRFSRRRIVDREVLVDYKVWIAFRVAGLDGETCTVGTGTCEGSPLDQVATAENVSEYYLPLENASVAVGGCSLLERMWVDHS